MTITKPLQTGGYKGLVERVDSAKNAEEAVRAFKHLKAVRASGGDAGSQPIVLPATKSLTGAQRNPLRISDSDVKGLDTAALLDRATPLRRSARSSPYGRRSSTPTYSASCMRMRLLDYLPTQAISAPSLEVIVHSSSTGAPAPAAEGAAKPEVVLNTTSQTYTAIKLAAHVGISYETPTACAQPGDISQ